MTANKAVYLNAGVITLPTTTITQSTTRNATGLVTVYQPVCGTVCDVVDGSWGAWSEWSRCSVSCGGGQRARRRVCDSPSPSHRGRYCVGSDTQNAACNRDHCPGERFNSSLKTP